MVFTAHLPEEARILLPLRLPALSVWICEGG